MKSTRMIEIDSKSTQFETDPSEIDSNDRMKSTSKVDFNQFFENKLTGWRSRIKNH